MNPKVPLFSDDSLSYEAMQDKEIGAVPSLTKKNKVLPKW